MNEDVLYIQKNKQEKMNSLEEHCVALEKQRENEIKVVDRIIPPLQKN